MAVICGTYTPNATTVTLQGADNRLDALAQRTSGVRDVFGGQRRRQRHQHARIAVRHKQPRPIVQAAEGKYSH